MRVVPVIDIRGGRAVSGLSGDRSRYAPVTSRARGSAPEDLSDPRRLARVVAACLSSARIYVADLDRIEGTGENDGPVADLLDDDPARVILWDGGLAGLEAAPRHPRLAPIIASETLAAPEGVVSCPSAGDTPRPWLGLDLEERGLRTRSRAVAALGEVGLLRRAVEAGCAGVIVVFIDRVGTGAGLPGERLARLRAAAPTLELIAGGGIATLDDLRVLEKAGCQGALVATALHDGRLRRADLREAGFA